MNSEGSVVIYAFVIMPNHFHLIWQIQDGYDRDLIQMRFLKFTAQQIKFRLKDSSIMFLEEFLVNLKDRKYQFWQRSALSVDLWSDAVFMQKLEYIHNNPIQLKWKLAELPEHYRFSSANFYYCGEDEFNLVADYRR